MDGLSNLIGGRERTIVIGGEEFTLTVDTLGRLAQRERWLLNRRPGLLDVLKRLPPNLPPAVLEQMLGDFEREAKFGHFVDGSTWLEFEHSLRGLTVMFWLATQVHHGLTLETAARLVGHAIVDGGEADLRDALADVSERSILQIFDSDEDADSADDPDPGDGRRRRRNPWAKLVERLVDDKSLTLTEIAELTQFRALFLLGLPVPEHITRKRRVT